MKKSMIIILFLISTAVSGAELSTIALKGWAQEELAADHLRFSRPENKELTLHLQVDSYDKDNFWNKETLSEDINKMASLRKAMSFFLGTTDYQISSYKLENDHQDSTHPRLWLVGSYRRLDHQLIQFCEINFYQKEHFLQLKIISEGKLPSDAEIEELIKQIDPYSVDID